MKYTNAWIEKGYFDERPIQRVRIALVEFGERDIRVEWEEGPQAYSYEGLRNGQGHFLLRSTDGTCSATLHRFQRSTILEGFWKCNEKSGFWRVHLPEDAVADVVPLRKAAKPGAAKPRRRARSANQVA